ncbi:hypothetical protein HY993_05005 [Candidatus Micrarchaeota archaeon]|nr:hypothetical protein [Candidatus Micrarchaeota archaeon]
MELKLLKEHHDSASRGEETLPGINPGEPSIKQAKRVKQWAVEKIALVQAESEKKPVPVFVGFSHEPVVGANFGLEHPIGEKDDKFFTRPGQRPMQTQEGLVTLVSRTGKKYLLAMKNRGKKGFTVDYIGKQK